MAGPEVLRAQGLPVARPRLAVLDHLADPDTDDILAEVRRSLPRVSVQAGCDVLRALTAVDAPPWCTATGRTAPRGTTSGRHRPPSTHRTCSAGRRRTPKQPARAAQRATARSRAAASLHSQDSDFGQAGALYDEVFDDGAKERFRATLTGQDAAITVPEIRERCFPYWTNVDPDLGAALRAAIV